MALQLFTFTCVTQPVVIYLSTTHFSRKIYKNKKNIIHEIHIWITYRNVYWNALYLTEVEDTYPMAQPDSAEVKRLFFVFLPASVQAAFGPFTEQFLLYYLSWHFKNLENPERLLGLQIGKNADLDGLETRVKILHNTKRKG